MPVLTSVLLLKVRSREASHAATVEQLHKHAHSEEILVIDTYTLLDTI